MRTVLIGTVACLTAGAFFGAERFISSNAEVVALEHQAATQANFDAQLKQSQAGLVEEIAALKEAGAASATQIATLSGSVETLTAKRDELALQLITVQDEAASSLDRVAEVEAKYTALVEKAGATDAEMAAKEQELDALRTQAEAISTEDVQLTEQVSVLSDQIKSRDRLIASLTKAVRTAKEAHAETIAAAAPVVAPEASPDTASAELAELSAAHAEELASVKAELSELSDALNGANETLGTREDTIAALETELSAAKAAAETVVAEAVVEPSADQQEQVLQIAALDAQIAELTQTLEEQNSALANLRLGFGDGDVEPMKMAEVCIARASGILESTQITFGTGTSAISSGSIATLESLRDLAIGCKNEKVVIEIGGHTDSFGAESANQALSEARAESVKQFLADRGIDEDNMIAVGYGEAEPVASNDTPEGRAANRRITFMWQMREPAEPVETDSVTDTVDG